MKKYIFPFFFLFTSLAYAQGYEQAKDLLDKVSKEMKTKKKHPLWFHLCTRKQERTNTSRDGGKCYSCRRSI